MRRSMALSPRPVLEAVSEAECDGDGRQEACLLGRLPVDACLAWEEIHPLMGAEEMDQSRPSGLS